jgi:hypothetical protein
MNSDSQPASARRSSERRRPCGVVAVPTGDAQRRQFPGTVVSNALIASALAHRDRPALTTANGAVTLAALIRSGVRGAALPRLLRSFCRPARRRLVPPTITPIPNQAVAVDGSVPWPRLAEESSLMR